MTHEEPKTDDAKILTDAIRDNFSLEAVAAMASPVLAPPCFAFTTIWMTSDASSPRSTII